VVVEPNGQAAQAGQNQDPAYLGDANPLLFSDKLSAGDYLTNTIMNQTVCDDSIHDRYIPALKTGYIVTS